MVELKRGEEDAEDHTRVVMGHGYKGDGVTNIDVPVGQPFYFVVVTALIVMNKSKKTKKRKKN